MKFLLIFCIILSFSYKCNCYGYQSNNGHLYHNPTWMDSVNGPGGGLEEFYKWKIMDYEGFDQSKTIPYNSMPVGVDRYQNKLFITVPRRRTGIPSTLNYVDIDNYGEDRSPKLKPFPSALITSLHEDHHADSNKIISVYRTRIDECNRLWFIDTGRLEYFPNQTQIQPPAIWIMNPETGERIHRFEFPADIQSLGNGLPSITVDVPDKNSCENAFAYIPDLRHYKLYVYSLKQNRMWKFEHEYFNMDDAAKNLTVDNFKLNFIDGIFSITLGPYVDGERIAYFHPMLSFNEFMVSTKVLQDESKSLRQDHGIDFKLLGYRGFGSQSAMHQYDHKTGVMFYTEVGRNAIGCMNRFFPFHELNHAILAQDAEKMIYPSDLKVDDEGFLWFFTNNMPRYIYSQLDSTKDNFRIWRARAKNIIRGTLCWTGQP